MTNLKRILSRFYLLFETVPSVPGLSFKNGGTYKYSCTRTEIIVCSIINDFRDDGGVVEIIAGVKNNKTQDTNKCSFLQTIPPRYVDIIHDRSADYCN